MVLHIGGEHICAATHQTPPFERRECAIEAVADLSMATSGADVLDCLQLSIGCSATLALELERVDLTAVHGDQVRHAWAHA